MSVAGGSAAGKSLHPRNGTFRLHPTLGAAADAPSTACRHHIARRMWTRGVAPPRTAPEDTFLSVRRSEAVSARDREPLLVPNKMEMVLLPHARHAHTHPPRRAGASIELDMLAGLGLVRRRVANFSLGARRRSAGCLLYTSPSPRDLSTSRMPSSA